MSQHALKSPSGADTWMLCPGSVRASLGMPDSSSKEADEGTTAHWLAAHCLKHTLPPDLFLGDVCPETGLVIDDEMVKHIPDYIAEIKEIPGALLVEQRLDLRGWIPPTELDPEGGFGTGDAVILRDDAVEIRDLKYGKGKRVRAKDNRQLRIYALGALRLAESLGYEPKTVTVGIHQPRIEDPDPEASEYRYTVGELLAFGEEVRVAAAATEPVDAPLVPGEEQCRWCRAKATCPAIADVVVAGVPASPSLFKDETSAITPPSALTPEDLARIYPKLGLIKGWIKECEAYVRQLASENRMPGYKMVAGRRGNRAWANPAEAEAALKKFKVVVEKMYKLELITPTAAEKLAKAGEIGPRQWPQLQTMIVQPPGEHAVVPVTDPRPAIKTASLPSDFLDF